MNMFKNPTLVFVKKIIIFAVCAIGMGVMTGCQTVGGGTVPAAEFENFTPQRVEKRVMDSVKVRWEVRQDVAEYCAKASRMTSNQAYWSPPLACAFWNVPTKECVIVPGKDLGPRVASLF